MPRIADEHLEAKIAQAALLLWRTRGAKGLTLRSVAETAGTTTTTVYKRFRNKEALLLALTARIQEELTAETTSARTIEECCRKFLGFAERHPHEYNLLWGPAWPELLGPGRPRPIKAWLLERFAERFGGNPREYVHAYYALFLMVHGTAKLLTVTREPALQTELRDSCVAICDAMVANVDVLRKPLRNGRRSKDR